MFAATGPLQSPYHTMKTKTQSSQEINHDEIRELAFLLWEQAGCPAGRDREFWVKAEEQIVMPNGLPSKPLEDKPKMAKSDTTLKKKA